MILLEDLLAHKDTLTFLGWREEDVECITGTEAMMLMSLIQLKEENMQLRKDLNKTMRAVAPLTIGYP
jgi:hypothetical protein